jgi:hypothetical protein
VWPRATVQAATVASMVAPSIQGPRNQAAMKEGNSSISGVACAGTETLKTTIT